MSSIQTPKPENTSTSRLQLNYNAVLNTAVAARELQLAFLEKQYQSTMGYIQAIAQAKKLRLEHSVDPQDVAEMMLSLIDQENKKYWHEGDETEDSESEVEEKDKGDEEIEKSKKGKAVIDTEEQNNTEQSEEESPEGKQVKPKERKAVINTEEQSETDQSEEERQEGKKVRPKKRKAVIDTDESETDQSEEERQEGKQVRPKKHKPVIDTDESETEQSEEERQEGKQVRPKKRKAVIDTDQSETEESEEQSQQGELETEESETEAREKEIPATGKQPKQRPSFSHHLNRKCLVGHGCTYEGPNLKRHLKNVHAKRHHIHENQINRYFAMGQDGHKKRGPAVKPKAGKKVKGRWKRWCPVPDCNYLGAYLSHHLQNRHRMKPSSTTYKISLKIVQRYNGTNEELQQMARPSGARRKGPQSDDSDEEEDVIAPTPPKRKAGTKSPAASVPAQAKTFISPSKTSATPSKTSTAPSNTSSAPSKTSTVPSITSDAVPCTSTSVQSEPCDKEHSDEDESEYPMAADFFEEKNPKTNHHKWLCYFYRYLFTPSASFQKDRNRLSTSVQSEPCDKEHSDEDESEYPMAADFFEEKNPKTNHHKWLCYFYRYLFTPSASFQKDRNRLQHACQVKKLIKETDPHGNDIFFLVEEEGNRVWVDWVIPNLQKKEAGTLKSYLTSFQIFLAYISKKGKTPHLPVLDMEVKHQLFDLCNSLKKWRRCITKETTAAKWDRYLDEFELLLTNEEVEDILSSKPVVDGRAALLAADQAEEIEGLSISQYCKARDFLIVTLTRAVGTRPAALENATLEMFEKAQWDDEKRKKVMLVSSHKREEDGPAPILMSPETEFLVTIFINKLRPLVCADMSPKSKIFLKNDSAPFQKGTIGQRVRAFVVKSGIRPDKPISATDFRKWIVTEMKRKKRMGIPIDEQLLRRLMCHSDKTANEWYLRESLTQEAAEASVLIEKHTRPSKEDSKVS